MKLQNFKLLEELTESELESLKPYVTSRNLGPKESLALPNGADEIYLVRHGLVKLYADNSIDFLKYLYRQWDVIGILPILGRKEKPNHEIHAITDVILLTLQAAPLRNLAHGNLRFCASIMNEAAARIQMAENYITYLHEKSIEKRLLCFLSDLSGAIGRQEGEFCIADNILTNQELADLISASRQSVNKAINALKRNGLVVYDPDNLGVHISIRSEKTVVV